MIECDDQAAIHGFIQALYGTNKAQKNDMDKLDQWSRKSITQHLIKTVLS